eukprot:864554-Rhodomonas_salina.1
MKGLDRSGRATGRGSTGTATQPPAAHLPCRNRAASSTPTSAPGPASTRAVTAASASGGAQRPPPPAAGIQRPARTTVARASESSSPAIQRPASVCDCLSHVERAGPAPRLRPNRSRAVRASPAPPAAPPSVRQRPGLAGAQHGMSRMCRTCSPPPSHSQCHGQPSVQVRDSVRLEPPFRAPGALPHHELPRYALVPSPRRPSPP